MTTDKLAVDRDELVRIGMFLVSVIDSESTDPALREAAQVRFDELDTGTRIMAQRCR
jgi:hypothetical protein